MGRLFVVSAPSGAGKTSLTRALKESLGEKLWISVSHTTRPERSGEQDGVDYCFVSSEHFQSMQAGNAFLESADVFGHAYGTSRADVEAHLNAGQHVLLEIDWQGAYQVFQSCPGVVSVFILPPSLDVLENRLRTRAREPQSVIDGRFSEAQLELSKAEAFDYWVVNDVFEEALAALQAIFSGDLAQNAKNTPEGQLLFKQLLSFSPDSR